MKFIAGKVNNAWLTDCLHDCVHDCNWIKVAVAFAHGNPKLIEFSLSKNIPMQFWGTYDPLKAPISIALLERFLLRRSPNFVCKLVPELFHPKVIWWGGYGAYIGSANLTDSGWYRNIECGLFLTETELIQDGIDLQLEQFFERVDRYAHALTDEILAELREAEVAAQGLRQYQNELQHEFDKNRRIPRLESLISVDSVNSNTKIRESFLKEWNDTLQILRDIGQRISNPDVRPSWIGSDVPRGVQADQFLHAHYYSNVKEGNASKHQKLYEMHKDNPERALLAAFSWWHKLDSPPHEENRTIDEWAPFLRRLLSKEQLLHLTDTEFREVCARIHAMRDHSLRVDNQTYGLPKNAPPKDQEQCINLLAQFLLTQMSGNGKTVKEVIFFVLYGGTVTDVPLRIWEATHSDTWRIAHLGISSLGEIVGWAMPDHFPPRNGRSSKCLTALGYKVTIHSGA
ncbi:MAG: phospholipase D family protein [Nitrospira sp.]|uniref:Phospholipase D/Transphosphatidylase n=1 Tax=Nitrospira defluvii TaxID=330214 RepID=A0ABN7KNW4_9BACT|nr:phospholipase D family protein [Nitrospira defluvii]MCS6327140.1 phospholipase D family protein [Nitrospira sp.]CAE6703335.1 Phospholipase D/Transphosphatidylase [Nitrospira defluvii]